jgi:hypothetical protein
VQLPPLAAAPLLLMELLRDPEFRRQIRAYNQAFAFTSIGTSCNARDTFGPVNQDESVAGQRGVYMYRIQGAMGHYLGSLLPYIDARTQQPTPPKFAQIYIVDPDMEQRALRRRDIFSGLDPVALGDIEAVMAIPNEIGQKEKLHRQTSRSCIAVYVVSGISTRVRHTLGHTIRGSSSARRVLDPHPAGLLV